MVRTLFVTGKGGVGKSTVAAGLAMAAVARDGGAVLIEFGEGASAGHMLAKAPSTLKRVVIKLDEAVERAARPLFGGAFLARLALQNFAIKPLVRAAPALREIAVLELVRQVVAENPTRQVIVDMPATGHGLAWLQVPAKGAHLFMRGPLYQMCEGLKTELLHPAKCEVIVVTLPERLVLLETMQLCEALEKKVGLPASRLIVNRLPASLTEQARVATRKLTEIQGGVGEAAVELLQLLNARHALMKEVIETVEGMLSKERVTMLPLAPYDPTPEMVAEWIRRAS